MSSVQVDYRYAKPPVRPIALPAGTGLKIDEGAPDGRLFPAELLARAYRGAISRAAVSTGFPYGAPRGSPALREGVASLLPRQQNGRASGREKVCPYVSIP